MMSADARIPVLIVQWPGQPDAVEPDSRTVLILAPAGQALEHGSKEEPGWATQPGWAAVRRVAPHAPLAGMFGRGAGHLAGCACCVARQPLAEVMSELFRQRALGTLQLFTRVLLVVPPEQAETVSALLISDRLIAGRFRQLISK